MSAQKPKYLDENEDILQKNVIYACEHSLKEIEPEDSQETKDLIMHEKMFNRLSIT